MAACTGAMVGPELARMGEHGRPILGEVFVQRDLVLASRTSPSRDRFGGDLVEGPVRRFRRFGLLCHAASQRSPGPCRSSSESRTARGEMRSYTPRNKPTPAAAAAFRLAKPTRWLAALALLADGVAGRTHGSHPCRLCRKTDGQQTPGRRR
jgi:hypothetical protein